MCGDIIANQIHPAVVTVVAIFDDRNIQVDDVAIFEWFVIWDSVTDHIINRVLRCPDGQQCAFFQFLRQF